MNLAVSQRHEVFTRSAERSNIGRCAYVVTGLASAGKSMRVGTEQN